MSNKKWLNYIPIAALVLIIVTLVAFQFFGPEDTAPAPGVSNPVLVTVNGEDIYYSDYLPYMGFWAMMYGYEVEEMQQDLDMYERLLEAFIGDKLRMAHITDLGITYDEEELDVELGYAVYQLFADEEDQAENEALYGFNEDTIRWILIGYMLEDAYFNYLIDDITLNYDEDDLYLSYLDFADYFYNYDLGVSVSHILVETEEEAYAALQRLNDGEDFAALALEISLDYSSAINGGKIAPFTAEASLVPEFIEASFSLTEPGELTTPVASYYGYHIIKLRAIYEEGSVLSFEDAMDYLPYIIASHIRDDVFDDLMYFADIEYGARG